GKEAGGGVVRLQADHDLTVDSTAGTTPISVLGGDADAFTTGGGVFLGATAGDVNVLHGAIEADGLGSGLGSDAGAFSVTANAGKVVVAAPLSAVGGAGLGSGCVVCEIRAAGS